MPSLHPAEPLLVAPLFPEVGRELVALLRSLSPPDWERGTVARQWRVRDVAAHLLDSSLRRLSMGRDGFQPPPPETPIASSADLVAFLNRLNAEWVTAFRRVSPGVLIELLEDVEPRFAAHMAALDPWGKALFPVAWAGESESQNWFDIARELTERWHHQQQIRLAVGAPPLNDPHLVAPVLESFLRALPSRYAGIEAAEGAAVVFSALGRQPYEFTLRRGASVWELLRGEADSPAASVSLPEETAWLLFTKGVSGEEAKAAAILSGEERLVQPIFTTLAVMA